MAPEELLAGAIALLDSDAGYRQEELEKWRALAAAAGVGLAQPEFVQVLWRGAERLLGEARRTNCQELALEAQRLFEATAAGGSRTEIGSLDASAAGLLHDFAFRLSELELPDTPPILALRRLTFRLWKSDPDCPGAARLMRVYAQDLLNEGRVAESAAICRDIVTDLRPLFEIALDPDLALNVLYALYRASRPISLGGDPREAHEILVEAAGLLDRVDAEEQMIWRARLCIALADAAISIAQSEGRGFAGEECREFAWRESMESSVPLIIDPALVGLERMAARRWLNERSREWLSQAGAYLDTADLNNRGSGEAAVVLELETRCRRAEILLEMGEDGKALALLEIPAGPERVGMSWAVDAVPEFWAVTACALLRANRLAEARELATTLLDSPAANLAAVIGRTGPFRAHLLLIQCQCDIRIAAATGAVLETEVAATVLDRLLEAIEIDDRFLDLNSGALSDRLRFGCIAPALRRMPAYLGIYNLLPADGRDFTDRLYDMVLRRKFRASADLVASYCSTAGDQRTKEAIEAAKAARRALARADVIEAPELGAFRERRRALVRALDAAELRLSELTGAQSASALSSVGVRGCLGMEDCLLDFVIDTRPDGSEHYGLFILDRKLLTYVDLGEAAALEESVRRLLEEIAVRSTSEDALARIRAAADRVADVVIKPILDLVANAASLLISPAGPWLGKLPFALLPVTTDEMLIDWFTLRFTPSASFEVISCSRAPGPCSEPLVLGDPAFALLFPEGAFNQFEQGPLPTARREAEEIAALLGVRALVGEHACKGAIEEAASPAILHLATHGFEPSTTAAPHPQATLSMNVTRPVNGIPARYEESLGVWISDATGMNRSDARADWLKRAAAPDAQAHRALLLAGFYAWAYGVETPPPIGSGLLTASEFASLDLKETSLVVLSACSTGLGEFVSTDSSIAGFRRSAFIAGARTLLTSLWRVPDGTTTEFMICFYGALAGSADPAGALRSACLAIRESHPHPRNWAAFLCEGSAASPRGGGTYAT